MRIVFTKHAQEKLLVKNARAVGVTRRKVQQAFVKPIVDDRKRMPHRLIGRLSNALSLCVIYKLEKGRLKVVTFYPAEKGRYEGKILARR